MSGDRQNLGAAPPSADAVALCGRLERLVFISSSFHTGDLKTEGEGATGLEGADNICNLRAQEAGLPGTYTAWLSDSTAHAKDRVTQSKVPYVRTDGVLVADDFTDLLDCGNPECLQAPINNRETGSAITAAARTGTNVAGLFDGQSCGDWTDTGADGILGHTSFQDGQWTNWMPFRCDTNGASIYCFQDTTVRLKVE